MNITEFLEARIAEDETVARLASSDGPSWDIVSGFGGATGAIHAGGEVITDEDGDESYYGGSVIVYDEGTPDHTQAQHIARNDPTRVLAECAAKRAIIAHHTEDWGDCTVCLDGVSGCGDPACCGGPTNEMESWPCPTIRAVVAVYADHPDYLQEWTADTPSQS
jgi:hypothetical protein